MPLFNLANHQLEIQTLDGESMMFRLDEISGRFKDDDVIFISPRDMIDQPSIPCVLSSAKILFPAPKKGMEIERTLEEYLERNREGLSVPATVTFTFQLPPPGRKASIAIDVRDIYGHLLSAYGDTIIQAIEQLNDYMKESNDGN